MLTIKFRPLQVAMAAVDAFETDDWALRAILRGLLVGYDRQWRHETPAVDAVELVRQAPLVNPATGRKSRTWTTVGVIDKVAGTTIYDHKTTSLAIDDPAGPYWRQLAVSSQASLYDLLGLQAEARPTEVVWDVVRRTQLRPKQLAKKDQKAIWETGFYHGFEIVGERHEVERENEELFYYRVAAEVIANPGKYYARRSVPRTDAELVEYASELWHIGQEMRDERRRSNRPFKNSNACYTYGAPCEYLPLCSGEDLETSDRWGPRQVDENHPGGESVLSHSRIACWQTCRRKHYYRYEKGIQRIDHERSEALNFGSAWHHVMDCYWQALMKEKRNGYQEQPARRAVSQANAGLAGVSPDNGEEPPDRGGDLRPTGSGQDFYRSGDSQADLSD